LCPGFNEPAAARTATLPDAAERRRYALLQAAATMYAETDVHGEPVRLDTESVDEAELLLAIIERRELERANG